MTVTTVPSPNPASLPTPTRRRPQAITPAEGVRIAGVAGVAVILTALVFLATPLSGAFGSVVFAFAAFVALEVVDVSLRLDPQAAKDRTATILITGSAGVALVPLGFIVWYVVSKGIGGMHPGFFTKTLEEVGPLDPASAGGAEHAIIGSVEQVGLASLIATPLGILTAVYLSEYPGRLTRVVRFFVDSMSGIPSVVAGLFIYTLWVVRLEKGFSGLAAAMALSVLMLPTVARTAEEMLKLVPDGLRESSLALGAPKWRTVTSIVLPTARSGLITAGILGVARIAGETAPLLMTAFGTDSVNVNPTKGAQSSLPLFVYQRVRNAVPSQVARGWAGALVLILLVLTLFTVARLFGRVRKAA
ncbi:MAG: phosphate ABC transporter permease PstA [Acidobacteria bacterium]|nr:phosphate ABC transporter permease PstA [Acidobacteriota bacterium]